MDVTAKRVTGCRRMRTMAGEKRRQRVRLGDDFDTPRPRWVASLRIVVAAHEQQRDRRMPTAPSEERRFERRHAAGRGVQKIAQHDQRTRTGRFDQRAQPMQIRGGRTARHRNAAGTKRGGLAEVNVGDEQRSCRGPMQRTRCEQLHPFTENVRDQAITGRRARRVASGQKGQRDGEHA